MGKRRLVCNGKCSVEFVFNKFGCVLFVFVVRVYFLKLCEEVDGWLIDWEFRLKIKMGWRGMVGRLFLVLCVIFLVIMMFEWCVVGKGWFFFGKVYLFWKIIEVLGIDFVIMGEEFWSVVVDGVDE